MYRRYIIKVVTLTLLLLAGVAGFNFIIDPYGYFRSDFSQQKIEPNQQLVKMKYILHNPKKYDCFIFGSSRCGNMDPEKIPGRQAYNMTYSEGLPAEWLGNIRTMIDHGVAIKTLILCLDDFSFRIDPAVHQNDWLHLPYRDNLLPVYARYLLRIPQMEVIRPYFNQEPAANFFDIYGSGRPLHPAVDLAIEKDPDKHVKDPKFLSPMHHEGSRIPQTIADLKQIKDIAARHHIELIVIINPVHIRTYLDNNLEEFYSFQRELVKITPFFDFSVPSSVSCNNYYYYETSHYRPMVGDWIIKRIFTPGDADIPADFGTYITRGNIDRQIIKARAKVESIKKEY